MVTHQQENTLSSREPKTKTKINLLCYCSNTGVSFGVFLELCFSLPITMFKPVLRCQFQVLSLSLISKRTEKKNKHRTLHLKPYVIEKNLHSVLVLCGITLFQGLISSFNLTETDFNTEFTNE